MEEGEFERDRWGLRFVRPETERAYRDWRVARTIPFVRTGNLASVFAWAIAVATFWIVAPNEAPRFTLAAALGPAVLIALVFFVINRPSARVAVVALTAASNAVAGLVGFYGCGPLFRRPDVATMSAIVCAYFGFSLMRLPPVAAAAGVATYCLATEVYLVNEWLQRRLLGADALLFTSVWVIASVTGALVCTALEKATRSDFVLETTIERQERIIAEERAKSEGLPCRSAPPADRGALA